MKLSEFDYKLPEELIAQYPAKERQMCQWGAYGLAKKGKKAEEILKFYYPAAEITTIDKVMNKL